MSRWSYEKDSRAGQKSRLWPVLTTDVSLIEEGGGHSACALLPQERANIFLRLRTKLEDRCDGKVPNKSRPDGIRKRP
ncbi:hypothetical protein TNIN_341811 [Trichonephila inaurata madagascariensis]|uniref:Uncharacterized protein n=1 Tax=Trichonephila inaurata madagascariensis TaxID=2747483 RepID=A0A8X7CLE9_9ARAC|nr:hypothetical protein TNIN_341811 [Trichonephila inaurata madagascariensis]